MSYRRAPLARWSRRDGLPVLEGALTVTVLVGVAVLWVVDAAGLLPVFGVQLLPSVDPWLVAAIVGATLATLAVSAATPARCLRDDRATDDSRGGLDD